MERYVQKNLNVRVKNKKVPKQFSKIFDWRKSRHFSENSKKNFLEFFFFTRFFFLFFYNFFQISFHIPKIMFYPSDDFLKKEGGGVSINWFSISL